MKMAIFTLVVLLMVRFQEMDVSLEKKAKKDSKGHLNMPLRQVLFQLKVISITHNLATKLKVNIIKVIGEK